MLIWLLAIVARCIEFNHTSVYEYVANLTLFNSIDNTTIANIPLYPTSRTYSSNYNDSNASLCFALPEIDNNYKISYPDACSKMGNNTVWVTPLTKNLQSLINNNDAPANISGIIISFDDNSEADLADTLNFTLRVSLSELVRLTTYYNIDSMALKANITFECMFNCNLYSLSKITAIISECSVFAAIVVWIVLCNKCYYSQCQIIHKIITFLPIFKILYWVLQSIIIGTCPWQSGMEKVQPYLYMLSTSVSTIFETFLIAVIYMLALGYSTVRTEIMKESVNSMIFYMGSIYILDSIYFISTDQNLLKYIIMGISIAFYTFFLYKLVSSTTFNIRVLSLYKKIISNDDNMETTCLYIAKKRNMLIIYMTSCIILLLWFIFAKTVEFFLKTDKSALLISAIGNMIDAMFILFTMALFNPIRYNHDFTLSNLDNLFRSQDEDGDDEDVRKKFIPINKIKVAINNMGIDTAIKGENIILHFNNAGNPITSIDPLKVLSQSCHLCYKK